MHKVHGFVLIKKYIRTSNLIPPHSPVDPRILVNPTVGTRSKHKVYAEPKEEKKLVLFAFMYLENLCADPLCRDGLDLRNRGTYERDLVDCKNRSLALLRASRKISCKA